MQTVSVELDTRDILLRAEKYPLVTPHDGWLGVIYTREDAEEIARRCNSHDALLAACKAFLWRMREFSGNPRLLLNLAVEVVPLVEAAVATAEGKEQA